MGPLVPTTSPGAPRGPEGSSWEPNQDLKQNYPFGFPEEYPTSKQAHSRLAATRQEPSGPCVRPNTRRSLGSPRRGLGSHRCQTKRAPAHAQAPPALAQGQHAGSTHKGLREPPERGQQDLGRPAACSPGEREPRPRPPRLLTGMRPRGGARGGKSAVDNSPPGLLSPRSPLQRATAWKAALSPPPRRSLQPVSLG